jgi:hypothetical protein
MIGTSSILSNIAFTNQGGTVNVQTGTIDCAGGFVQSSGTTTISAGATLISSSAHSVTLSGGTLVGGGSIGSSTTATNVVNNGGTVSPAGAGTTGILTVYGNFTQAAGGTLAIDLGGHTAGTQYDQLAVTGTSTLGGTLSLSDINSFVPANLDSYTIMTFASASGNFATVGGPASGFAFTPVSNGTNLALQVTTTPGSFSFSAANYLVNERTGTATITVNRTGGAAGAATVHFATSDGTGTAGVKYTSTSGTLTFANGVVNQTFSVSLMNDGQIDGNETINLTLSNASGASLGSQSTSVITVQDENGTQIQRFVATVYWTILNRHVDSSGLSSWTSFINGSGTRTQMVRDIEKSTEYLGDVVNAIYLKYLHRPADSGGLASFANFLANGGTDQQVAAMLVGSAEYYQVRGGGSVTGFLNALYSDALNRTPDSVGVAAFTLAINSGATDAQVATAIFGSTEYLDDLVNSLYSQYLLRPADSTGLASFVGGLQTGALRTEDVIADLVGSGEYLANVVGN